MAKMVFQYDVKTPAPGADINEMISYLRESVPEGFELMEKIDTKKLFFGVQAAVVQYVCDASDGTLQDKLENYLNDGVSASKIGEWELSFTSRL